MAASNDTDNVPVGRLILYRFCGVEEFVLTAAEMIAFLEPDGVRLWFEAETEGECIRSLADTAPLRADPKLSVCVPLAYLIPNELVGQRFTPVASDADDDPPGTFYYVEHDDLRECSVEVLGRDGQMFEARLTGVTTDVNYYDGSKPPPASRFSDDSHSPKWGSGTPPNLALQRTPHRRGAFSAIMAHSAVRVR